MDRRPAGNEIGPKMYGRETHRHQSAYLNSQLIHSFQGAHQGIFLIYETNDLLWKIRRARRDGDFVIYVEYVVVDMPWWGQGNG